MSFLLLYMLMMFLVSYWSVFALLKLRATLTPSGAQKNLARVVLLSTRSSLGVPSVDLLNPFCMTAGKRKRMKKRRCVEGRLVQLPVPFADVLLCSVALLLSSPNNGLMSLELVMKTVNLVWSLGVPPKALLLVYWIITAFCCSQTSLLFGYP
uniref:Uncharacterized protein n=1 Tax=Spongospora subterranea TaxID=70186 RepID=A0A0H5QSY3_9EUKA|eukprot:CRZ05133.1 hypothetical protein [Spongospora subterranea]